MQLKQQIEPCMRITVQIPKDAAQRLRQLATEGNPSLRALGIRSVQLEGDSLISLNLGGQQIDVKVSDISSAVDHVTSGTSISGDGSGGARIGGGEGCNTDINDLSQLLNVDNLSGASTSSAFVKLPQVQLQQQHQHQQSANLLQQQQRGNMAPNINFGSSVGIGVADGTLSIQQQQILQQRRNIMLGGPSTSNAAIKQQHAFNTVLGSQQQLHQQQQLQQPVFKSPNTVCPMDGKVPVPPLPAGVGNSSNSREFPFESMRQARVLQGRDNSLNAVGPPSTTSIPTPSGIPLASGKPTVPVNASGGGMQHQLMGSLGPPPNVALKVIKNPQSGEIITTTVSTATGKSQFLQPPPPPYPGVGTVTSPASQNSPASVKPLSNYLQSRVGPLSTPSASPTSVTGSNSSNNIAMSSPLLVNLLQNDNNSVASQHNNQVKSSSLSSPQHQQHHQQLPLMHQQQQQQQSPMMAAMSPQQQVMNSPLRTTTPGSEFMIQQHTNHVQQQIVSAPGTPENVLSVPSSPTAATNTMRSIPNSQQMMLSPSNSNMYAQQQQQQHQQRFQQQLQQQQQQISPQQAALLRQRQQQLQTTNQLQNQQRFVPQQQQQQMMQQSLGVNAMLGNQQQQMRQVRVGSGGGVGVLSHQTPPSPLQQQQLQQNQHQQRIIGQQQQQQQQQYISGSSGNMSPAAVHSPASSHHSMHSPHMASQHSHQQLLSPSTTPAQSPLTASHLTQQLLPPPQSPSTGLTHNASSSSIHIVPSSPSTSSINLPPPPDYNQAAASSRWPAALSKPMDSATKSSFQEFTRYQMQYNLQQQQTQQQQQQIISEIANSLPGASSHHNHMQSSTTSAVGSSGGAAGCGVGLGNTNSSNSNCVPGLSSTNTGVGAALDSQTVDDLTDPLITLSDLDALTTNDLDALLPTLSCDIDSSLSLDDKNELESLLQDAKDLDLDLIEGMDIDETAAAATSLLTGDEQLPPNVDLTMDQLQSQQQQQQSHHQVMQQQLMQNQSQQMQHQHRQLELTQQNHTMQQQQSQQILQQRLQQQQQQQLQQQHHINQQNNLTQSQQHQQFHMSSNQHQQQFTMQKQQQQHSINTSNLSSTLVSSSSNTPSAPTPTQPKQFLINPLTGELEPSPSDDSETEAEQETLQSHNPAHHNISNAATNAQGTNYTPNSSSNSIYELLPNSSSHYSEDSNSNSCSTAISKMSTGEQNNGGSSTPQLLGAGSDTERSRDSSTSTKSQKNRKSKANVMSAGNHNINSSLTSSKPGDMGSPRSNSSSPSVVAMLTGGNTSNKKSKTNLLREKLQQGIREKKSKEAANAGVVKPKRERTKAISKSKAALAATAATTQTQIHTQSKQNSAISGNLISVNTTSTTNSTNSSANTLDTTAAQPSATTVSGGANVAATEKIKLRLKLGKSEPVSPAYKVDVTFSSENVHQQQQQSQLNAQKLANNILQQKLQQHNQHMTSSQYQQNPNLNTPQQNSLQQTQQHLNHQQSPMNPPQYRQQESHFPQPSSSAAAGDGVSTITTTTTAAASAAGTSSPATDEPRVPPLHISLRGGKNSIVIKNSRKERKKTQNTTNASDAANLSRTSADNESFDSNKTKSHLKRTHLITENTNSSATKGDTVMDEQSGTESKQPKHGQSVLKSSMPQVNGMPNLSSHNTHSNTENKLSPALVAGKNGLTISSTTATNNATMETNKGQNLLMDKQNLGSSSLGTVTNLPPQQLLQPSTQQQLAKITSLPNSITLSTITNPNNSSGNGGVGANSNSLQMKHNLKTTATITPIQGKPLTKNHKPPSYITAVQQLQLQKQQQQQQLAALAENQTQQQMIAAAVTMLPSATTLKRVEITKVERKDAMGNVEHVLIKSNEPVTKGTTLTTNKANTQVITSTTNATTTTVSPSSSVPSSSSFSTNAKASVNAVDSVAGQTDNSASTARSIINHPTSSSTTTGTTPSGTVATTSSTTIPSANTNYNQSSLVSTLRNSPASTGGGTPAHTNSAGGEDSGIESMDALSEKSPHQLTSSSPQSLQPQITSEKPPQQLLAKAPLSETLTKTSEELPSHLGLAEDEIEKALAKMEGCLDDDDDDDNDNNLLVGERLKERDGDSTKENLQQNPNADHSIYGNNLIKQQNNKAVYNNVHHHHHHLEEEEDDDDDEDLIKNLTASIIEEHEAGEKAAKEKLENERREKEKLVNSKDLVDIKEEAKKYKLREIKTEDFEEKITNTTTIIKKDDSIIKIEVNCNNNNDKDNIIEVKKIHTESLSKVEENKDQKSDCVMNKQIEPNHTSLSTPISIEIPQATDNDSPRIRTRASSRLGSPMDVTKSSPSLDANVSSQSALLAKHVVSTRSSSHTHERVSTSPKLLQTNSCSSTSLNTTTINSCANSGSNNSQMQHLQNNHKRKRRESEGSSNSNIGNGESDSKRVRSGSTGGSSAATLATQPTTIESASNKKPDDGVVKTTNANANATTKKVEESSDSDEPLIEVAGKVRSSKAAAAGSVDLNNSSLSINTHNSHINSSTSLSFTSTNLENSSEKVTRTSRSQHPQQNKIQTQMFTSATGNETCSNSSNTNTSNTSKSGKANISHSGQTNNHPNTSSAAPSNNVSSVLTSNSTTTPTTSNLTATLTPLHATRGACHNTTASGSVTNTVTTNQAANVNNSSISSPSDEKIGTRRSVRASAAANKMIYTRSIHHNSNSGSSEATGKVPGKSSGVNSSSESVAEARRKTRSAVVGEAILTEGRRRRGSRDYK